MGLQGAEEMGQMELLLNVYASQKVRIALSGSCCEALPQTGTCMPSGCASMKPMAV